MGRGEAHVVSVRGIHQPHGYVEAFGGEVFLGYGVVILRMIGAALCAFGNGAGFGALEGAVDHAGLQADAEDALAYFAFVGYLHGGKHVFIEGALIVVEDHYSYAVFSLSEAERHVGSHENRPWRALVQA